MVFHLSLPILRDFIPEIFGASRGVVHRLPLQKRRAEASTRNAAFESRNIFNH
jgi:hypothetical protein